MDWIFPVFLGFFGLLACVVATIIVVAVIRMKNAPDKGSAPRMQSHAHNNMDVVNDHHNRFN